MTTTTSTDAGALWQNLADALNSLITAGQFPDFHDLYGPRNHWQHQPFVCTPARADAPWVVFDLPTRQFTVSTRERTRSGEHHRRPPRRRR
ncbi:hypothetical protein ACFY91_24445 [Streptomyces albogriseolus]|uniref:hypothetical protein n=1 Tax=Streptomyces albogriseolus TaxID=1887 RepID=UPI0036E0A54A